MLRTNQTDCGASLFSDIEHSIYFRNNSNSHSNFSNVGVTTRLRHEQTTNSHLRCSRVKHKNGLRNGSGFNIQWRIDGTLLLCLVLYLAKGPVPARVPPVDPLTWLWYTVKMVFRLTSVPSKILWVC